MTFQRFESILGAFVAAAGLTALGVYVLRTHKDLPGLCVGVVCIVVALGILVPVQLKAGAKNVKDAGRDVHDALVVVGVPMIVDAQVDGGRRTDPQSKDPV